MFSGATLMIQNKGVSATPYQPYSPTFENKTDLSNAIDAWIDDQDAAIELYGDINTWDVSEITDFSSLFKNKSTFNSDISDWDVSNGTNFSDMFSGASNFKQDISEWYDQIRMLDAENYPHAFLEISGMKLEFRRASLRTDGIYADVKISSVEKTNFD